MPEDPMVDLSFTLSECEQIKKSLETSALVIRNCEGETRKAFRLEMLAEEVGHMMDARLKALGYYEKR